MSPLKAARLLLLAIFALAPDGVMATNNTEAEDFLTKYGYLGGRTKTTTTTEEDVTNAIKDFQGFVGLNITGQLDDETVGKMNAPRCGVKDRRYDARTPWNHSDVTYYFQNYSPDLANRRIDQIIKSAFDEWQHVANINFAKKLALPADIVILFGAGNHGDSGPFDGPGGVLAHAFYPQNGDTHFDEDEQWTRLTNAGTNLFQVAVHEFGHAIGLGHSDVNDAIMYPYYRGYVPDFSLQADDIAGAKDLYGPRPGICQNPVIDAITQQPDGHTYVFQGTNVYKLQQTTKGFEAGYPKQITKEFPSAPTSPDAVITYGSKTFFLKEGIAFWFNGKTYRRRLSIRRKFKGVPKFLNAAFTGSNRLNFLKGEYVYKHNPEKRRRAAAKQQIGQSWTGAPSNIDAAGRHNGALYFFKGDQYYLVDEVNKKIAVGYPKPTVPDWFGCP